MLRRATTAADAALAGIYNHYVAHTIITFEAEPVSTADMAPRIASLARLQSESRRGLIRPEVDLAC